MITKGGIRIFSKELKAAAKCSYPYTDVEFNNNVFVNTDYFRILNILSRNKVLLTCYRNLSKTFQRGDLLELKRAIEKEIDKERRLIIDVGEKIREVNELLEAYGIRYLLPKFTFFCREHDDIDILVSLEDFNLTLESLKSENYVITSIQSPWKVTTAKWIEGRRSSIHVHCKLHWYHRDLEHVPSEKLWKRSILIDDDSSKVPILSPEDSILVSAAHAIFENHEVSLSDIFQITGILRRFQNPNWNEVVDIAFDNGWCFDLFIFLSAVNYLSFSLYRKTLVPESFFFYAKKRMSRSDRIIRKLAGNVDLSSIPCNYPYPQVCVSFVHVVFKRYGVNASALSKVIDEFVYRAVFELKSLHGDPCALV